jgi:hypothetical protein
MNNAMAAEKAITPLAVSPPAIDTPTSTMAKPHGIHELGAEAKGNTRIMTRILSHLGRSINGVKRINSPTAEQNSPTTMIRVASFTAPFWRLSPLE